MTATITEFLAKIEAQIGVPYAYGGAKLAGEPGAGLDCSGLPYAVAASLGVAIPRTSEEQFAGLEVINADQVAAGDLVFYNVPADTDPQPAHEAVVAIPGDEVVQAPHTGERVETSPLNLGYTIMGYRRIAAFHTATPTPAPTPTPTGGDVQLPELSESSPTSDSEYVKSVQALLTLKFNAPLAVDGAFGPLTAAAVRNLQTVFKIAVDGVVGPQTWSALLGL